MSRTVKKTAHCDRCGSDTVAWRKSKAGKWYLTEVFIVDGETTTDYRDFHSKYCEHPAAHELQQQAYYNNEREETETDTADTATAIDKVEDWIALHDWAKSHPEAVRVHINLLVNNYADAEIRVMERIRAEVAFLMAALGTPLEYDDNGNFTLPT